MIIYNNKIFVYLFIYLFIYLSIYSFIYLLFIYLFILNEINKQTINDKQLISDKSSKNK